MTILNKLPTKDGLFAWGWTVDDRCQLCFVKKETKNHHIFFFVCLFKNNMTDDFAGVFTSLTSYELGSGAAMD